MKKGTRAQSAQYLRAQAREWNALWDRTEGGKGTAKEKARFDELVKQVERKGPRGAELFSQAVRIERRRKP